MEIVESVQNNISVFKLTGDLNSATSPGLEKRIFNAIEDGTRNMILDFMDLDYISSAGLRVIVKTARNLKQSQGAVVLCSMQDYVKEVFEIAGFDSFLPIVPTLGDAMEKF
jgi:anti-sigma B factor antagonist